MKVAWFTPLSIGSAIGRASACIAAELATVAEVEVCYFDSGEVRQIKAPGKRFSSADSVTGRALSRYDFVFYNLGNNLPYHREIYLLSRRHPGICILHDVVMHHFFAAYYLEELRDAPALAGLMERHYGEKGRQASGRGIWETPEVTDFPLFEEAIVGAKGVITHSAFFKERVQRVFPGPVHHIPLPYDADLRPTATPREQLIAPGDLLIVTVGQVNSNKQIDAVIRALARSGSERRYIYAVLGHCPPEYKVRLQQFAHQARIADRVRILGPVSDDLLHAYLQHADICATLRYPVTEGASASVIEEMLFGKPVIVNKIGFYAELPDDCVVKVPCGDEAALAMALKGLMEDDSYRNSIGSAAQIYAKREFRADRYAREVLDFAWEATGAQYLLHLADHVAAEFTRMRVAADTPVVDRISATCEDLFSGNRPTRLGK
ncbi:MAG TPA: glycosyltransferase family 4 protein [Bryobacteraceae bacterium]|jgi:glycosyltransferase involved in cell wall biosynthesis|nr:glycosyltransferase family 4 protein [Bryobacteraceae bacterium]